MKEPVKSLVQKIDVCNPDLNWETERVTFFNWQEDWDSIANEGIISPWSSLTFKGFRCSNKFVKIYTYLVSFLSPYLREMTVSYSYSSWDVRGSSQCCVSWKPQEYKNWLQLVRPDVHLNQYFISKQQPAANS